jgi:hypothetical protein
MPDLNVPESLDGQASDRPEWNAGPDQGRPRRTSSALWADDAARAQVEDLRLAHAEVVPEHLVGVLTEPRRRRAHCSGRPREPDRGAITIRRNERSSSPEHAKSICPLELSRRKPPAT